MKKTFEIDAQSRSDMGKGASRRLRHTGMVPGVVYGAHKDPEMLSLVHSDLIQHLNNEAFYSHILTLNVDGKGQQVILKDLQRHPAKPFIQHIDFLRVSATEKLKTNVPLHFIGEDDAVGVKAGGAASHHITDVEVSCLPGDLPEFIEVDVSALDIGDNILMSGIVLPEGVELPALMAEGDHDLPVVTMHAARTGSDEDEEELGAAVEAAVEEESGE